MRLALLVLILGLPGAALAAEDRYGPARRTVGVEGQQSTAGSPARSGYSGPMLGWSGKSGPAPAPRQPVNTAAPARQVQSPPVQSPERLPASLYDDAGPAVATPQAAAMLPEQQPPPPRLQQAATWTAPPPAALPPPPAPTQPTGAPVYRGTYGANAPRAYSVVREFGGQPDRIPAARETLDGRKEITLDPALTMGGESGGEEPSPPDDDAEIRKRRAMEQPNAQGRTP
jgi:hypothetical protein